MDKETEEYDYAQYNESLSKILEHSAKDYWCQLIDINRHQVAVARTYLWVSAALLGAYFAALSTLVGNSVPFGSSCAVLLSAIAIVLAAAAFGVCLYALPGRKGYLTVCDSWRTLTGNAYRSLENKSSSIYAETLTSLIEKYDVATDHGRGTNQTRAKLLRINSWILIGSFSSAVFSATIYTIDYLINLGAFQ